MKSNIGVWIDHKKAIIVMLINEQEEIKLIRSQVERHLSRSGDSPLKGSYESQSVPADDSQQRSFTAHLNVFYDNVIDCMHNAESILLLGPGEAKGELQKRLQRKNLTERIVGMENLGKMTHRQIAAVVREFFIVYSSTEASVMN